MGWMCKTCLNRNAWPFGGGNLIRIGVLALQGSVEEHLKMLSNLQEVRAIPVKTLSDIKRVDGIILPGGESTTQAKLLRDFDLFHELRDRIKGGLPVWGTCAGLILLAKNVINEQAHLGVMDVTVRRNAYGRQLDSFSRMVTLPPVSCNPVELVFIRAPWIEAVHDSATVLAKCNGHIVAARQGRMLGTAFHPELTQDASFHRYFVDIVSQAS